MIFIKNTERVFKPGGGSFYKALYRCPECNREIEYTKDNLRGKPKNYPCIKCNKTSGNFKHGLKNNIAYKQWGRAKSRCNNKNSPSYKTYGGRGIKMHKLWETNPKKYVSYVSSLPNAFNEGRTIDRVHNDFGYEPMNLRWSTQSEQVNNQRVGRPGIVNYIGVSISNKRKDGKPFISSLRVKGKLIYLGNFETAIEAAQVRNDYIDEHNLIHRRNDLGN